MNSSSWFNKVNELARQADTKFKEKANELKLKYETGELQKEASSALSKAKEDTQKRLAGIKEKYESGELEAQAKVNWARVQVAAAEARIAAAEVVEKNRPLLKQLQEGLALQGGLFPDEDQVPTKVELWHVTDRVWAMPLPGRGGHAAAAAAARLERQFGEGRFMVYNLSEEQYDYALFNDQVLEYKFPGHPAPPLGLLFKIVFAIAAWLEADERNVAVVHCLTGKGRTATVLACLLAWTLEVDTPLEGLQLVADRRGAGPLDRLAIPSQRRYVQYFSSMMDGLRPQPGPWLLRRCIMNTIPKFALRDGRQLRNGDPSPPGPGGAAAAGCCPYLQVFKGGVLIFTTTWKQPDEADRGQGRVGVPRELGSEGQGAITLPWAGEGDGSVAFPVDTVVQGDILIRCRHLAPSGARASMFRAAFHTGYLAAGGVLRLTKAQLDGACGDSRFEDDFFVDLIFAPIEKEEGDAGAAAGAAAAAGGAGAGDEEKAADKAAAAAAGAAEHGRGGESGLAAAAGAYDALLARDQGLWEAIARRRQARAARPPPPPRHHRPWSPPPAAAPPPPPAFSIGDEGHEDEEAEMGGFAAEGGLGGGGGGGGKGGGGGGARGASSAPPPPSSQAESNAALLSLLGAEMEGGQHQRAAGAAGEGEQGAAAAGSGSAPLHQNENNVTAQLSALEELERELGLEGLGIEPPPTTAGSPPAAAANGGADGLELDLDDDLEGLESYLQSLTATAGGGEGAAAAADKPGASSTT